MNRTFIIIINMLVIGIGVFLATWVAGLTGLGALAQAKADPVFQLVTTLAGIAGGLLSSVIDLANFQAAPIVLRGFDMANVATLRSAFATQMMGVSPGGRGGGNPNKFPLPGKFHKSPLNAQN